MRNWKNHRLADVDYAWDGYWFKEVEKQRSIELQKRYAQQGNKWVHDGPLDDEKLKLSALEMNEEKV